MRTALHAHMRVRTHAEREVGLEVLVECCARASGGWLVCSRALAACFRPVHVAIMVGASVDVFELLMQSTTNDRPVYYAGSPPNPHPPRKPSCRFFPVSWYWLARVSSVWSAHAGC